MSPRISSRRQQMDSAAVQIRFRDAATRLVSAELHIQGASPHEWKHAAEVAVSAGIAASDAMCGHVLGYKVTAESHRDAVDTLRTATDAGVAKHLNALLEVKSAQSYGDRLPSKVEASRSVLHARRLVDAATATLAK